MELASNILRDLEKLKEYKYLVNILMGNMVHLHNVQIKYIVCLSYHFHSWQKQPQAHSQLLTEDMSGYEELTLWPILYHQDEKTYTFQLCPFLSPGHLLF